MDAVPPVNPTDAVAAAVQKSKHALLIVIAELTCILIIFGSLVTALFYGPFLKLVSYYVTTECYIVNQKIITIGTGLCNNWCFALQTSVRATASPYTDLNSTYVWRNYSTVSDLTAYINKYPINSYTNCTVNTAPADPGLGTPGSGTPVMFIYIPYEYRIAEAWTFIGVVFGLSVVLMVLAILMALCIPCRLPHRRSRYDIL